MFQLILYTILERGVYDYSLVDRKCYVKRLVEFAWLQGKAIGIRMNRQQIAIQSRNISANFHFI